MFKLEKDFQHFNGALDKTLVSVSEPEAMVRMCVFAYARVHVWVKSMATRFTLVKRKPEFLFFS